MPSFVHPVCDLHLCTCTPARFGALACSFGLSNPFLTFGPSLLSPFGRSFRAKTAQNGATAGYLRGPFFIFGLRVEFCATLLSPSGPFGPYFDAIFKNTSLFRVRPTCTPALFVAEVPLFKNTSLFWAHFRSYRSEIATFSGLQHDFA